MKILDRALREAPQHPLLASIGMAVVMAVLITGGAWLIGKSLVDLAFPLR